MQRTRDLSILRALGARTRYLLGDAPAHCGTHTNSEGEDECGLCQGVGKRFSSTGGFNQAPDHGALVKLFGEDKAPFALGVASLIMGFPIFFEAGFSGSFSSARRSPVKISPTTKGYFLPPAGPLNMCSLPFS